MRHIVVVFLLTVLANQAMALSVPGTSVDINPPPGFVITERFPGFMNKIKGSSIMISEFPDPYAEVYAAFIDLKKMRAYGMALLGTSSVNVDGQIAMLLHVVQSVHGTQVKKWILIVDRSGSTTLIVAAYPSTESKEQEQSLKEAILTATFGKQTDPMGALSFTIKSEAPFKIARVMGQNLTLSPNGQFPIKDKNIPFMILGLSITENWIVPDRKEFAEHRVKQLAAIKNVTIQQSKPVTIGPLTGYSTLAEGMAENTAIPLTVYQVMLFDSSGYCLMIGVSPSTRKEEYLPIFKKIVKSFRMKSVAEKNVGLDKHFGQMIIGEWKSELSGDDFEIKGTNTYAADGKLIFKAKMKAPDREIDIYVEGKWIIENGVIVNTVTSTNFPEIISKGSITKDTIIKLDSNVLEYRDEDGEVWTEYRVVSKNR